MARYIQGYIEKTLRTQAHVGNIQLGLGGRLLIDRIALADQQGHVLASVEKVGVYLSPFSLLQGEVEIYSLQLFTLELHLNKATPADELNAQFLLNLLQSSDDSQADPLHLRIGNVVIRNATVNYDVLSEPTTPQQFNAHHLALHHVDALMALRILTPDTLNATIRTLSLQESSGLELKNLAFSVEGNRQQTVVSNFCLELPHSLLACKSITAQYPTQQWQALQLHAELHDSYLTPADFSPLLPALGDFCEKINLQATLYGTPTELHVAPLQLATEGDTFAATLQATLAWTDPSAPLTIEQSTWQLAATHRFVANTAQQLGLSAEVAQQLQQIGDVEVDVDLSGTVDELTAEGTLRSNIGKVCYKLLCQNGGDVPLYSVGITTSQLALGRLLGDSNLMGAALQMQLAATPKGFSTVDATLHTLQYGGYTYAPIVAHAEQTAEGYAATLRCDDPNATFHLAANLKPDGSKTQLYSELRVEHLRPHNLLLSPHYEDGDIRMTLAVETVGNSPNNVEGKLTLNHLTLQSPQRNYHLPLLTASLQGGEAQRTITVESDFLQAAVVGQIDLERVPESFLHIAHNYLPALTTHKPRHHKATNNFKFMMAVNNADFFDRLLYIPLALQEPAHILGSVNEPTNRVNVEAYLPQFTYDGEDYKGAMLRIENSNNKLQCHLNATKVEAEGGAMRYQIVSQAADNLIDTTIQWDNNQTVKHKGKLTTHTTLERTDEADRPLAAKIEIEASQIILSDTTWMLHPSTITLSPHRIAVNKFVFEHRDKHLIADGVITNLPTDTLSVDLNEIHLEYVFDVLQFHPVDLKGMASGEVRVSQLLATPQMAAHLFMKDFAFNNTVMGDAMIRAGWHEQQGVLLDADVQDKQHGHVTVKGYVSPIEDGLDLHIQAERANIGFINHYTEDIFDHVEGRANASLHLYGPFSEINLIGHGTVDAAIDMGILSTRYYLRDDSIKFRYNQILFEDIRIFDRDNHLSHLNGYLNHSHLADDMVFDFNIKSENFLIYDDKPTEDQSFYGTVYATGNTHLTGDDEHVTIDMNITPTDRTVFVYNAASPDEITDHAFITFVDPFAPQTEEKSSSESGGEGEVADDITTDIRLNIQAELTPAAQFRVIMDPLAGDHVRLQGFGNIRAHYYNKGDFKMYGNYTLERGVYKLSLQEVIRKDFLLRKGGTLSFSGDPYDGTLNLQAVYTVNSASLADLVPGNTFSQNSVRVNCLMNLTGNIFEPDVAFDIELPTINEEEKEIVHSYISSDEQMEMQIIYLLAIGRFYTYDNTNSTSSESGSSKAMSSLLSSTLSSQLNTMISQVIDSNQWTFGTNLSTGDSGWSDVEVEGLLSGRLLNNRLLINGQFGYRNSTIANANFIGDFDVQWLLTQSGNVSLKGYNQTNDRYFTKATLNTQGVGIILRRDFDAWREVVRWRRKRSKP